MYLCIHIVCVYTQYVYMMFVFIGPLGHFGVAGFGQRAGMRDGQEKAAWHFALHLLWQLQGRQSAVGSRLRFLESRSYRCPSFEKSGAIIWTQHTYYKATQEMGPQFVQTAMYVPYTETGQTKSSRSWRLWSCICGSEGCLQSLSTSSVGLAPPVHPGG